MRNPAADPPEGSSGEIELTVSSEGCGTYTRGCWDAAEPGKGFDTNAAEWKGKLGGVTETKHAPVRSPLPLA